MTTDTQAAVTRPRVRSWLVRRSWTLGVLALDAAILVLLVALLPILDYERGNTLIPTTALILGAVVGVALAGGHQLMRHARSATSTFLGGTLGLVGAWLLLKLFVTKLEVRGTIPPDVFGLAAVAAIWFGWSLLSRRWLVPAFERSQRHASVVLVGEPERVSAARTLLGARGLRHPILELDQDLGESSVDAVLNGRVHAVVVLGTADGATPAARKVAMAARRRGVETLTLSQLSELLWQRTAIVDDDPVWLALVDSGFAPQMPLRDSAKRIFDIMIALTLLIAATPLIGFLAIWIRLSDGGPAFFAQERAGRWKRPFRMWKLRSMRPDAGRPGAGWTGIDDPRVTSLGRVLRRTHLDELPQLWNVICGHMSLVGPRPEQTVMTGRLEARIPYYDLRHLVRPGITGWAQVNQRYAGSVASAQTKLEYDVFYIRHRGVTLDIRILLRTVAVVLRAEGV